MPERLARIQDFLIACDRLKTIERRSYLADGSRHETDAEHCWHLALYALLLKDELGFAVDLGRTLALIAVHDLVEIHAGDTYAYDEAAAGQEAREAAAAEALFGRLPADLADRLHGWWCEFEDGRTPKRDSRAPSIGCSPSVRASPPTARPGASTASTAPAPCRGCARH